MTTTIDIPQSDALTPEALIALTLQIKVIAVAFCKNTLQNYESAASLCDRYDTTPMEICTLLTQSFQYLTPTIGTLVTVVDGGSEAFRCNVHLTRTIHTASTVNVLLVSLKLWRRDEAEAACRFLQSLL